MSDLRLWKVCLHECGHAVCAFILGATIKAGPLTIVPSGGALGRCWAGRTRLPSAADERTLGGPYSRVSATLRRFYECDATIRLAGDIAAELWMPPRGVELPEVTPPAEPLPVVPLPAREQRLLTVAAAATDPPTDFAVALKTLMALHFDNTAAARAHLEFLSLEARSLLSCGLAGRMAVALAPELMRCGTLPAARWLGILRAVR